MSPHAKGLVITVLGVLCVVPDALFVRLIDAPPPTVAFWRALGAGLGTAVFVLATSGLAGPRRALAQRGPALAFVLGIGASGVLFVTAVSLTRVANVVIILAAMPLVTALVARVTLGEAISRRVWWTMAVVAAGLAVVASGEAPEGGTSRWGDLAAFAITLCYGAALTAARRVREVSLATLVPLANLGTALVLVFWADPFAVDPRQWPLLVLHGGVFIAASNTLLALGPRYLPPAEVALLILLETVLAPLLVWAVVDEAPGTAALVGGAMVVGALVVSNMVVLRRRSRTSE